MVWPLWYESIFVWDAGVNIVMREHIRVKHWCDLFDMRTPSCQMLVWPFFVIWEHLHVRRWCDHCDYHNVDTSIWHEGVIISQWSHQHLTRGFSHITMVTPASHTKVLWYHNGHQRLTRSCSHITMVTPALIWEHLRVRCWYDLSLWYGNTFMWDAGVTIVIWEHLRVRRWCDHCNMRTTSCETLDVIIPQRSHQCLTRRYSHITMFTPAYQTKVFSYHKGHISVSHEGVLISQRYH
jgi:hypothetical protein